jgi:cardiolipin synthase
MKQMLHLVTSRIGRTLILVLLELVWIIILAFALRPYIHWLEAILRIISVFIVLGVVVTSRHLSSDLMYVILILLFPVAGTILFLFLNVMDHFSSRTYRAIVEETKR